MSITGLYFFHKDFIPIYYLKSNMSGMYSYIRYNYIANCDITNDVRFFNIEDGHEKRIFKRHLIKIKKESK